MRAALGAALAFSLVWTAAAGARRADGPPEQPAPCPLHGVPTVKATARIDYGKPLLDEEYEKAKRELFPMADEGRILGGCIVSDDSPRKARVDVCARCGDARKKWLSGHASGRGDRGGPR